MLPPGLLTPATVVLVDRLDANIAAMSAFAASHGVAMRPHAKTHKCLEIGRRQLAAGARGLSVATVGEAEAMSQVADDLFIAYPLWVTSDLEARISRLTDRAAVTVGADSVDGLRQLSGLAGRVRVMIEVDSGMGRTGAPPEDAGTLAWAAADLGLDVAGVFTFPGHSYGPGAGSPAAADEAAALRTAAESLAVAGRTDLVLSGGSTPSARATQAGPVNEMRPGVYVFNDAQQVELGTCAMEEVALVVAATVVSRPARGRFVLDAGAKVLGPDRAGWATGHGRLLDLPDARIVGLWEHHAVVTLDGPAPALGDVVAVAPNHVCTAVNLVPELLVAQDGAIVDRWPVAARAANR